MESEPEWAEEFDEQEKKARKDREMILAVYDFVTRAIVAWTVVTLCGLIGWCIYPYLMTK